PEIHSNHFHFRFDCTSGDPLHLICPTWVERVPRDIVDYDASFEHYTTLIWLPFKASFTSENVAQLALQLRDIHGSLLLFLRRLRRIMIMDTREAHSSVLLEREDLSRNITRIAVTRPTEKSSFYWYVARSTVKDMPVH